MNLLGPSLRTHLLYLVLKYLHEKGWKESVHELERESRLYFDIKYFEEMVLAGKWDDIEYYLSGFTKTKTVKLLSNTTVTDSAPIQDEESTNKSMPRKLPEFLIHLNARSLLCRFNPLADKIVRLSYNNAGNKILALASNGHYLVWEWPNPSSQDVFAQPQIYLPRNGLQSMRNNDLTRTTNNVYSFAISKRDEFLLSTSGGNIYIFSMSSFLTRVNMSLPTLSVATCVAYYPLDNNVIFVGVASFVCSIESCLRATPKELLHLPSQLDLIFLSLLMANAQIFVWDATKWKKLRDKRMPIHVDIMAEETSGTEIQFNRDLEHFLAVQSTILAIYEAKDLLLVKQWAVPEGSPMLISQATFSCDGMSVCSPSVYPLAITAHPLKNSQFAVGLSDELESSIVAAADA
ncbi:WD40-repeat-containing domain superfamily [Sesbania bispinosa]|nr:WD40-repeat-containing domain superfamily [Sesbania bispinosa]